MLQFNPDSATRSDMNHLADQIEHYLEVLEELAIIPEELEKERKNFERGKKVVYKLIRKLRKGDTSIFKDTNEDLF